MTLLFLVSCSNDDSSPSSTVRAYHEAVEKGDLEAILECYDKNTREGMEILMNARWGGEYPLQQAFDPGDFHYSICEEEINGDKATVKVKMISDGKENTADLI